MSSRSDLAGLSVDRNSAMPVYAQIRDHLLGIVRQRQKERVSEFFTDDQLSGHFGVSRMTARQAISELVQDGLLLRQKGVGTFVAPRKLVEQEGPVGDFFDDWAVQGHRVAVEVPEFRQVDAGAVAFALAIPAKAKVLYFRRRRLVDGEAVALDERWVAPPASHYLTIDELEHHSIHLILAERMGLRVARAQVEIEASLCEADQATLLDIEAGDPVLLRTVTPFSAEGRPLWTGHSVYRADRYKYSTMVTAR